MLSRQEELKERARLLLEQARRDAALKASNKSNPSSAASAANRVSDVSLPGFIGYCHVLMERVWLRFSGVCRGQDFFPVQPLSQVCLPLGCVLVQPAWPHCAGAANRLTTSLFSTLKSPPQLAVHYMCNTLEKKLLKVSASVAVRLVEPFMEGL